MNRPEATSPAPTGHAFVAHSELRVTGDGVAGLISAFQNRLGEVERSSGFERLEVWQDEREDARFVMVSWWDDKASFQAYMRSESHRRSHDRIQSGPDGPRPVSFSRFRVVAR